MRSFFLSLVLANLLLLAWHFWVDPASPVAPPGDEGSLALFAPESPTGGPPDRATLPAEAAMAALPAGACFRLGPVPSSTAAQQAARVLASRGVDAVAIGRDAQLWLGHWVQVTGFAGTGAAESARERLVAAGLADALLMQDGSEALISLGVFRERDRADRVAGTARNLGFQVEVRDRFRPGVEQWLLVRPRAGQALVPSDLALAGDRIMRAEPAPCPDSRPVAGPPPSATDPPGPGAPE